MTISAKICEIIRNVRVSKGYSQEYLSEKLGLTTEAYGKLKGVKPKWSLNDLTKSVRL
jgi:transcriptional regulator with XRE-family HTH domain